MIRFKKIKWKNFLSTGNQWTEIDFEKNSTTLIIGSNGAGKSTVLDALTFVLFNKPFRKITKSQLVNTVNEKENKSKKSIKVDLKYYEGQPVIREIKRISKPGRRVYSRADSIPRVHGGLGLAILSTSKGVMSDSEAIKNNLGGEVICRVF